MKSRAIWTLVALVAFGGSVPQSDGRVTPTDKVDAVFARMSSTTSPGCAVAVMREGKIIFSRGYGMANLDHDVAITSSTVFHIASVSKEFTAAAIVLLAQDGKLAFDDDVRKYIPELPDFGQRITIRHLIHHTSGLRDQWDLLGMAGWRYSLDLITDDDVLKVMTRQRDLNFRPGDRHLYSNTGYTLLAVIVKRVSGQSFREFTSARLFTPLGMSRTHFRDDHAEIIKQQAYGYVPSGNTFRLSVTNFDTAGATSLHTTVEDMARWDRNFYDARVGGRAFVDQLIERGVLNSGEKLPYAFGLVHGTYRGLPTLGHGGSDAGYRADFARFPTERLSIACLCNLSTSNPGQLTRQVAEIYLADRLGPPDGPPPLPKAISLGETDVSRHGGLYWNKADDTFRRFFVQDGTLRAGFTEPGTVLIPIGPGRFVSTPTEFSFGVGAEGRSPVTETPRAGTAKPVVFVPVDEVKPSEAEGAEYAGVYRSDEIEAAYTIAPSPGGLTLKRLKFPDVTLVPLMRDVFRTPGATVRFARDSAGRVSGFAWNTGRILGLRFTKDRASP
jgi:CubicO group peptidase (beta-lactamase class C family)